MKEYYQKNLELSYENIIYQIKIDKPGYGLRHAKIKVCEDLSGNVVLSYKNRILNYVTHKKQKRAPEIVSSKELDEKIRKISSYIPSADHPWKNPAMSIKSLKSGLALAVGQ